MPVKVCRSSQIYPSKVLLFALGMDHGEYPTVLGVAIASRTWYKERICGNILAVWGSRFITDSGKTAKKSPYSTFQSNLAHIPCSRFCIPRIALDVLKKVLYGVEPPCTSTSFLRLH